MAAAMGRIGVCVAAAVVLCASGAAWAREEKNVLGEDLRKCATFDAAGRAQARDDKRFPSTGFTRRDLCEADEADRGAHFVCVDLPKDTVGGGPETYSPFWTKTGQAGSPAEAATWPKPGPWCICMWAYAHMHERVGGTFDSQIDCRATNAEVVRRYDPARPEQKEALQSICRRCDLASKSADSGIRDKCAAALR